MPTDEIVLVTASEMPKPDTESGLLLDALRELGIAAVIRPWDQPWDWSAFALVVCRTPWNYFRRVGEFLAWARAVAAATRLENPIETVSWNAHKSYLLDLDRAGVPIVPTVLVAQGAGTTEVDAALARFSEIVIKPAVSGGAFGALRTDGRAPAAGEHLRGLLADGDALVQPFLSRVQQDGEASLIFFDGEFSHAVRKLPRSGDYRVHEHYGGTVSIHEPTDSELEAARATLQAAPTPTLYARIDLVQSPSGPLLMEAELIEPELFLAADGGAPQRFARCLARRRSPAADSYA
jgi:glutathione synthase/RimK-type ligase-like ATP-grasp enzyme